MPLGAASRMSWPGVEHWMGTGTYKSTNPNQTPNTGHVLRGSEAAGDKLRRREGNNPDRQLRPPSRCSVIKDVESL